MINNDNAALNITTIRRVIGLVASVQFFVALEGSMLLPLGPMLAVRLQFPVQHLGYLNGAFLASAAVAGLVGALVMDRFDRRVALASALAGLALGTAAAGLATSLQGLLICRVLAGLCGGPAVALALALVGDVAPAGMRGRAMGAVSAGASLALILGVPLALLMAETTGWRSTFFIVGAVGLALAVSAAFFLPTGLGPGRSAAGAQAGMADTLRSFAALLRQRALWLVLANGALIFSSINMLAMNLAAYFTHNLGVADSALKYLWAVGGVAGLVGGQCCGWLADRHGPAKVLWGISGLAAALYWCMFVRGGAGLPVALLMGLFLVCASGRIVLSNTIASLAPAPERRGRFMSLMSSTNQAASAAAMVVASQILQTSTSGALLHMDWLAGYAIAAALLSPLIASHLVRRQRRLVAGVGVAA